MLTALFPAGNIIAGGGGMALVAGRLKAVCSGSVGAAGAESVNGKARESFSRAGGGRGGGEGGGEVGGGRGGSGAENARGNNNDANRNIVTPTGGNLEANGNDAKNGSNVNMNIVTPISVNNGAGYSWASAATAAAARGDTQGTVSEKGKEGSITDGDESRLKLDEAPGLAEAILEELAALHETIGGPGATGGSVVGKSGQVGRIAGPGAGAAAVKCCPLCMVGDGSSGGSRREEECGRDDALAICTAGSSVLMKDRKEFSEGKAERKLDVVASDVEDRGVEQNGGHGCSASWSCWITWLLSTK